MLKRGLFWVAVFWTLLILGLCWIPRSWVEFVEEQAAGDFELGRLNVDKLIHFLIFAVLGFLWSRVMAHEPSARRRFGRVFALGLAVAILSEVGQTIPAIGRSMHLLDLVFDLAGLAAGIALEPRLRRVMVPPMTRADSFPACSHGELRS